MTTATQELTGTFAANPTHSSFQFAVQHMEVATFRAAFADVDARLEASEAGISLEGRTRVESVSIADPGSSTVTTIRRSSSARPASSSPNGGVEIDGELEITEPAPR
jgi:hypothetical protein